MFRRERVLFLISGRFHSSSFLLYLYINNSNNNDKKRVHCLCSFSSSEVRTDLDPRVCDSDLDEVRISPRVQFHCSADGRYGRRGGDEGFLVQVSLFLTEYRPATPTD